MSAITDRILTQLGDHALLDKLSALPKSDLYSILLRLFQIQANNTTPADVLKAFKANRFSVPSEADPVAFHLLEAELLSLAQDDGIKPVLLSPAAPFASCAAFGCVDQNNIVSAARGIEILSDPTNMLSVLIAAQRMQKEADNPYPLHYCTTARVLRAQLFPNVKGLYPHFGIFCIVSSGKDSGSYTCEKNLLAKHLSYYKKLFSAKYATNLSVAVRKRGGYHDTDGFFDSMAKLIADEYPGVPISLDVDHADNNYYKGINFKIYMETGNEKIEIGDGGFVDWMQRMTNTKKERCLISGIGLERLMSLYSHSTPKRTQRSGSFSA